MDPNNQQQNNIDGIKNNYGPPRPATPINDYMVPPPADSIDKNAADQPQDTAMHQEAGQPNQAMIVHHHSGKLPKILLVIFIVLFAASAATAATFYSQYKQVNRDLESSKSQLAEAKKQLSALESSTTKNKVDTLTTQNTALQKLITAKTTYIASLTKTAQDLKTKCSTSCSSIAIPVDTTSATVIR